MPTSNDLANPTANFTHVEKKPQFNQDILQFICTPFKVGGKFAYYFAKGKLGKDPIFAYLIANGIVQDHSRILDIGCGQGLLSALLYGLERYKGAWPAGWCPAPHNTHVIGIELMPKDVARAQAALQSYGERAHFIQGDMRSCPLEPADFAVVFDSLHYIPYAEQEQVLKRIHHALVPGGKLLLRIGDAAGGLGFYISNWVDAVVTSVRGHRLHKLYCKSAKAWTSQLEQMGFSVTATPMHSGTPFANILLICEKRR